MGNHGHIQYQNDELFSIYRLNHSLFGNHWENNYLFINKTLYANGLYQFYTKKERKIIDEKM